MSEKPLFVVDVDLTLYDCFAKPPALMPGAERLLQLLHNSGEVHLWSAGREAHCREVAAMFNLGQYITGYHDKPDYPPQEEAAIKILGRKATIQFDDDRAERIADWTFVWADAAYRKYGAC